MLGEDLRQPLVTVRRLVDTSTTQLHLGLIHPGVHYFLSELRLPLPFPRIPVALALRFHPAHDAAGAVNGRMERKRGPLVLDPSRMIGVSPIAKPRTRVGPGRPASRPCGRPRGLCRRESRAKRSCDGYAPSRAPATRSQTRSRRDQFARPRLRVRQHPGNEAELPTNASEGAAGALRDVPGRAFPHPGLASFRNLRSCGCSLVAADCRPLIVLDVPRVTAPLLKSASVPTPTAASAPGPRVLSRARVRKDGSLRTPIPRISPPHP